MGKGLIALSRNPREWDNRSLLLVCMQRRTRNVVIINACFDALRDIDFRGVKEGKLIFKACRVYICQPLSVSCGFFLIGRSLKPGRLDFPVSLLHIHRPLASGPRLIKHRPGFFF